MSSDVKPQQQQMLTVMTLNLQYFSTWPKGDNDAAGNKKMQEILALAPKSTGTPPDIVCVQEGLEGRNAFPSEYQKVVSSADSEGNAQSVREMVYSDASVMKGLDEEAADKKLCNELYFRKDSKWQVVESGVVKISSNTELKGSAESGRVSGRLAVRTCVWARLKLKSPQGYPTFVILNTHISGGRFEDQFFLQHLASERKDQTTKIIDTFERSIRQPSDIGVMVGDFNATQKYVKDGPMSGYFKSSILKSEGVKSDAKEQGVPVDDPPVKLEALFEDYMVSPFKVIEEKRWKYAYTEAEIGPTSGFGHLIDHMAYSGEGIKKIDYAKLITCNQKFNKESPDKTDVEITDHNAVKVTFSVGLYPDPEEEKEVADAVRNFLHARSEANKKVKKESIKELLTGPGGMTPQEADTLIMSFPSSVRSDLAENGVADLESFMDWLYQSS